MSETDSKLIPVAVISPAHTLRVGLCAVLQSYPEVRVVSEAASLHDLGSPPQPARVFVLAAWGVSPAQLLQDSQALGPAAPILLLVDEAATPQAWAALRSRPAWGLLPLEASAEELHAAVHALDAGLWVGAPSLLASQAASLPAGFGPPEPLVEPLTGREAEVLQLMAEGLTNKQIALRMHLSENTVKFHVSSIYSKLGAGNRTEAVRLGARQGLVTL